ncbi:MAG: beta-hydroxyacyl-ACP dehydratase, partial [Phycisphaerae bacterium]|nr:beta-hydroxyacyl-ACP dehydratase [Phycisphaerae bacterium]
GFGGVDDVKFRGQVVPGDRIIMLGKMVEMRKRRCIGAVQGFVNGQMVFEGTITGMLI